MRPLALFDFFHGKLPVKTDSGFDGQLILLCDKNVVCCNVLESGCAAHGHRTLELGDYLVHVDLEALLALGVDEGNDGSADQNTVSAQCQSLEHIDTRADTAVDEYLDFAVDRLDDIGQDLGGCGGVALNSAAVVRYDDSVGTGLDCFHCTLNSHDALDDKRHLGMRNDLTHLLNGL